MNAKLLIVDRFGSFSLNEVDFNEVKPLGIGNQGVVYPAIYDGEKYVLKVLRRKKILPCSSISSFPSGDYKLDCTEERILEKVKKVVKRPKRKVSFNAHKNITDGHEEINSHNIVKLEAIIEHDGDEYALIPYCDIFLCDLIADKFQNLDEKNYMILVCDIILGVIVALKYLNYRKDYVHRDINPANIALCRGKWCLIDFECAIEVGYKNPDILGSPLYMHPAGYVNSQHLAFPGNDLYALGMVIKDCLFEQHEYLSTNLHEIVKEKSEKFKTDIHRKWGMNLSGSLNSDALVQSFEDSNLGQTEREKLIGLSNRMCCLMSDQISIDDLSRNVEEIRAKLLGGSISSDFLLSSLKSNNDFPSTRRPSFWLEETLENSDMEDSGIFT